MYDLNNLVNRQILNKVHQRNELRVEENDRLADVHTGATKIIIWAHPKGPVSKSYQCWLYTISPHQSTRTHTGFSVWLWHLRGTTFSNTRNPKPHSWPTSHPPKICKHKWTSQIQTRFNMGNCCKRMELVYLPILTHKNINQRLHAQIISESGRKFIT